MSTVQLFLGAALTAVLLQLLFSSRRKRIQPIWAALLSGLIWILVGFGINQARWGWKTGPIEWDVVVAVFYLLQLAIVWTALLFPFSWSTVQICSKIHQEPNPETSRRA